MAAYINLGIWDDHIRLEYANLVNVYVVLYFKCEVGFDGERVTTLNMNIN